jgi:pimeloyl-ACP methyl ester carboxylesterase
MIDCEHLVLPRNQWRWEAYLGGREFLNRPAQPRPGPSFAAQNTVRKERTPENAMAEQDIAPATRQRIRLSGGTELSFMTAGEPSKPAVLLLHGTPNSSRMFSNVAPALAQAAYVIAPDLPGHGESDVLPAVSVPAIGLAISELLDRLAIGPRFIYLHDWGAPVGLQIAMQAPERVLGLIIQNANAHRSGFGPLWAATLKEPTTENEAAASSHLTFEFMCIGVE